MRLQTTATVLVSALIGACITFVAINLAPAEKRNEAADEIVASARNDLNRASSELVNERQYLLESIRLEQAACKAEIESLFSRAWVAATRSKLHSALAALESFHLDDDIPALVAGEEEVAGEVARIVSRYVDNIRNREKARMRIEILQLAATTLTTSVRLYSRSAEDHEKRQGRSASVRLALDAFDAALEMVSLEERSEAETRRSKSISRLEDALKSRADDIRLSATRN